MTFTLDELDDLVEDLRVAADGCNVWLFYGEMGAGKTTLIKTICKALGVNSPMTSPTFSIVNEYNDNAGRVFYHFDFYRLKNEEEAYDIGVEEYLDSGNLCFVEWPERVPSILPASRFEIHIEIESRTQRRIHYQKV
ncbi:MAG TPA: tRNA (adenosine(37)-N6)-threonylcarbamoyltransferase complex ATPase subunit type 1 TsaE [Cyclobacteriaceae bacterium]|nr:tRNA (adenosine(37)-N6)-threonylcarbamoyltransferase complex ATPase subunit type 1 TsaE [Cyclobacteriaceae bacterium]